MNFQDLTKIDQPQDFLDIAFRAARDRAAEKKQTVSGKAGRDIIKKTRMTEEGKIQSVDLVLEKRLQKILDSFPKVDSLPEFYRELVRITIDYRDLKLSLGAVNWAIKQIKGMTADYRRKVAKGTDVARIKATRAAYYGRVSSIMKQIGKALLFLEEARKTMRGFPHVKTSVFTVALFGFPNIGKTTLLSKLTGSTPDIQAYAFTTKTLNIGYFKVDGRQVQVIDTPGTLNRFEKMNPMEQQAHLALTTCADLIVYVFDLTEPFPLEDQKKLLLTVRDMDRPLIIYLTKKDIIEKEVMRAFRKEGYLDDPGRLKEAIISYWREKEPIVSLPSESSPVSEDPGESED